MCCPRTRRKPSLNCALCLKARQSGGLARPSYPPGKANVDKDFARLPKLTQDNLSFVSQCSAKCLLKCGQLYASLIHNHKFVAGQLRDSIGNVYASADLNARRCL